MIWTDFASVISITVNTMGGVFTTMDSVTIVTLPNAYAFTILDMGCAFMIWDAFADLISEV